MARRNRTMQVAVEAAAAVERTASYAEELVKLAAAVDTPAADNGC